MKEAGLGNFICSSQLKPWTDLEADFKTISDTCKSFQDTDRNFPSMIPSLKQRMLGLLLMLHSVRDFLISLNFSWRSYGKQVGNCLVQRDNKS